MTPSSACPRSLPHPGRQRQTGLLDNLHGILGPTNRTRRQPAPQSRAPLPHSGGAHPPRQARPGRRANGFVLNRRPVTTFVAIEVECFPDAVLQRIVLIQRLRRLVTAHERHPPGGNVPTCPASRRPWPFHRAPAAARTRQLRLSTDADNDSFNFSDICSIRCDALNAVAIPDVSMTPLRPPSEAVSSPAGGGSDLSHAPAPSLAAETVIRSVACVASTHVPGRLPYSIHLRNPTRSSMRPDPRVDGLPRSENAADRTVPTGHSMMLAISS